MVNVTITSNNSKHRRIRLQKSAVFVPLMLLVGLLLYARTSSWSSWSYHLADGRDNTNVKTSLDGVRKEEVSQEQVVNSNVRLERNAIKSVRHLNRAMFVADELFSYVLNAFNQPAMKSVDEISKWKLV